MRAIILCAGKGERLRPLTDKLPKPMVQIAGKPCLEYLINLCKKHGIKEIGINTSYLPEKIKEHFGNGERFGVNIAYSFEAKLLGTAGALNNFKKFLNETFFVIYGDNITNINLSAMLKHHKSKNALATLFVYNESMIDPKTSIGYIVLDEDNKIKSIIENPSEQEKAALIDIPFEKRFINAGVYVFEPEILNLIPLGFSDFARDIFPKALKVGDLYGFKTECYFREIGQIMRYQKAKQEIESGKIKLNLD